MIRVVIIDDHQLIRDGIERLVSSRKDMGINGSYSCATDFLNFFDPSQTDVVILDLSFPDCNGLDILKELKKNHADIRVLVLSMHDEEEYGVLALKNGASGYISKGTDSRMILDAIRKIYYDGVYISRSLGEKIAKDISNSYSQFPHESLSEREFQILCFIGGGYRTREIGKKLFISENTVRTYRRRIMLKMNMDSTAELIHYAVKHDLS